MFESLLSLLALLLFCFNSALAQELDDNQCLIPQNSSGSDICLYIRQNCDVSYFKWSELYYCSSHYPSWILMSILSLLILLALTFILISLSILVSNYLFRNLNEFTYTLGLNNQILSFILVPLTNSFPDLINYYVALQSGSSDLVIGQVVGSILIMFTIIIGLISIFSREFKVEQPNLLTIDLIWVLLVLGSFSVILSDGKITLAESITMVCIYAVYILFLSLFDKEKLRDFDEELLIQHYDHEHILEQPYNIEDAISILTNEERPVITRGKSFTSMSSSHLKTSPTNSRKSSPLRNLQSPPPPQVDDEEEQLLQEPVSDYLSVDHQCRRTRSLEVSSDIEQYSVAASASSEKRNQFSITNIFGFVFNAIDFILFFIIPIHHCCDEEDIWHVKSHLMHFSYFKYYYLIQVPVLINWEFCSLSWEYVIPGIIFVEIPLALLSLRFISEDFKAVIVTSVGIGISLLTVSYCSLVILELLKNFGLIWRISDYLLGLLVFSISNSINDLITNLTLATRINPILGINSCLGTPLLIILLGIGINGIYVVTKTKQPITFTLSHNAIISTVALSITILFLLFYLPWNKWHFDRKVGLILIGWYCLIMIINMYLG